MKTAITHTYERNNSYMDKTISPVVSHRNSKRNTAVQTIMNRREYVKRLSRQQKHALTDEEFEKRLEAIRQRHKPKEGESMTDHKKYPEFIKDLPEQIGMSMEELEYIISRPAMQETVAAFASLDEPGVLALHELCKRISGKHILPWSE